MKEILKTIQGVTNIEDSDGGVVAYAKNAGEIIADVVTSARQKQHPPGVSKHLLSHFG